MEEIVLELKKWMAENHRTQAFVARGTGISQVHVSRILRGETQNLTYDLKHRI